MEKQVEVMMTVTPYTPAELIKQAVDKGSDLEKIGKLLDYYERYDAMQAKKAYHAAMSRFKLNPPKIEKDKKVSFATGAGKTSYNHASLANVSTVINEALSKHGLSASWSITQTDKITVTCKITHVDGHSEETSISAPADKSGSKNDIQAIGSTISYLSRYSLLSLTGLASADQDDDGIAASTTFIDEKQLNQIIDMCSVKKIPIPKLLEFLKIEKLEQLPSSRFKVAITAIENKK